MSTPGNQKGAGSRRLLWNSGERLHRYFFTPMPYFWRNLSTRPPLSTTFCLPVKNGWHSEHTSMPKSLPRVERVTKLLPQAQVTLTSLYSGWMPSFMLNASIHAPIAARERKGRGCYGKPRPAASFAQQPGSLCRIQLISGFLLAVQGGCLAGSTLH